MESVKHEPNEQGNVLLMQACQELLVLFVTLPDGRQLLHGEPPYGQGTRCNVQADRMHIFGLYRLIGSDTRCPTRKLCTQFVEPLLDRTSKLCRYSKIAFSLSPNVPCNTMGSLWRKGAKIRSSPVQESFSSSMKISSDTASMNLRRWPHCAHTL